MKEKAQAAIKQLPKQTKNYLKSLFPIIDWLPHYNRTWFLGDVIAGVTVGLLTIPQALAYARLAGVPLEYGLYTCVTGVLVYALFATSKDVTIGPTAVLSQLCAQLVVSYGQSANAISFLLSVGFVAGILELVIGLFRLGIIVDFIPIPVIVGFTSGAGFSIILGQLPTLLGIASVNRNDASYLILFNTFKDIRSIQWDAIIGISALSILILFRIVTNIMVKRGYGWFNWIGRSSNFATIVVFTLISFALNNGNPKPSFKVVGNVPSGLNHLKVPNIDNLSTIFTASLSVVLVSILEHVAIAKSFGRLNGYTPSADQEIVALGITNTVGSFFGGFPACGSFSRSSVKSRSGVQTPLCGFVTATIVFLAIFVITPAFYYIPNAVLSAMIMNAIYDLICKPNVLKELWDIEILDLLAFVVAFLVTIFVSIELAIFCSIGFAIAVLLYRIARPKVQILVRDSDGGWATNDEIRQVSDTIHPKAAPPGIAVFRIEETLSYPNAGHVTAIIEKWVSENTSYNGKILSVGEQMWCEAASSKKNYSSVISDNGAWEENSILQKPVLEAIVFDFSAVNGIDATGVQTLVDIRRGVERFAGHEVFFYFAHVHPRLERVLHYFLSNLLPNKNITPVESSQGSLNPDVEQTLRDIDEHRSKKYGGSTKYSQQFIFRTIDQAVEDAQKRTASRRNDRASSSTV
jgi:sodium-independent sulfate anion transporter 11